MLICFNCLKCVKVLQKRTLPVLVRKGAASLGAGGKGWVKDCRDFCAPCPTYLSRAVLTSSSPDAMRVDAETLALGWMDPR